jgi:hypothetical protein
VWLRGSPARPAPAAGPAQARAASRPSSSLPRPHRGGPATRQVRAVAARAFQAAFGFAAVNRVDVPAGGLPALTAAGGSDLGPGRTAAGSP